MAFYAIKSYLLVMRISKKTWSLLCPLRRKVYNAFIRQNPIWFNCPEIRKFFSTSLLIRYLGQIMDDKNFAKKEENQANLFFFFILCIIIIITRGTVTIFLTASTPPLPTHKTLLRSIFYAALFSFHVNLIFPQKNVRPFRVLLD